MLRSRINRFKDGCEAYYTHRYMSSKTEPQNQPTEQEADVAPKQASININ